MKKKLLLTLAMTVLFVCIFALCVNAAQREKFQSYEVELVSGEKITVYQTCDWDQWQGRIWITDTMYTEAPVDTEATYPTVDWSQIKVLDFTNAWGHVYNATSGEYELKRGTNDGHSMHAYKTNFTPANATSLEKVITGVATIIGGNNTLGNLPALKEIVVDNALTKFGWNSVDGSKALTTVTFKEGTRLNNIEQQAFIRCSGLTEFHIPNTVTSMGGNVFDGCTSLQTVTWSTGMTTIQSGTFNGCSSLEFEIPSWITKIGGSAFKNCDAMVSFVIPDGVTEVGTYAFSSCDNLEEIVISDNSLISNRIVGFAEYCPKLTSIRIPPLVTDIGYDNFRGCTLLSEVIWPNNLLQISGGQNFTSTSITKVTIPNSVTRLDGTNFTNVEEFNFGASVTSLAGNNLISKNLKRVYLPSTITSAANNVLGYSNPADSSMNITFIFAGTLEEAEALRAMVKAAIDGTGNAPNQSKLYDAVLVSADEYDITQEPSGFTFVYGYSACDAFYDGAHQTAGNVTMQFSGYFEPITFADTCTREDCGNKIFDDERAIGALFNYLGYSYTEKAINGYYSMSQFYSINNDNVNRYKNEVNSSFELGIVVASVNNPVGSEFEGTSKVLLAPMNALIHNYFGVKVSGITEEHTASGVVFCAYVTDGEQVYYLDGGKTTNSVTKKSYTDIKALDNAKAE